MSPWEVNGSEPKRDRRSSTLLHTLYGPARVMQVLSRLASARVCYLQIYGAFIELCAMVYGLWSLVH